MLCGFQSEVLALTIGLLCLSSHSDIVPIWEMEVSEIDTIVDVNTKGMLYGNKVAMTGMIKQGSGYIYNMVCLLSKEKNRKGLLTSFCRKGWVLMEESSRALSFTGPQRLS